MYGCWNIYVLWNIVKIFITSVFFQIFTISLHIHSYCTVRRNVLYLVEAILVESTIVRKKMVFDSKHGNLSQFDESDIKQFSTISMKDIK